jgi:hypothetical protein
MTGRGLLYAVTVVTMLPALALAQDVPKSLAIDPSENVKSLNEAAQKRQDDLRIAGDSVNALRYTHLQDLMSLRADYEEKLRTAEAKRIDAIRLVDTTAVAVQNDRAVATATTLAKVVQDSATVLSLQVTKSADDLRTLVATTAAESNRNLQQQFAAITTRVSALEQGSVNSSGIGAGRSDVAGWAQTGIMMLIAAGTLMTLVFFRKTGK